MDTGLNNFGYSVFDGATDKLVHYNTIRTKSLKKKRTKKEKAAEGYIRQIETISEELTSVIDLYDIKAVTGEMPTFGAQSSNAAISLASGVSIILALAKTHKLPTQWISPRDLKLHFIGDPDADKKAIMWKVCSLYGWYISEKAIFCRKTGKQLRTDNIYHTSKGATGGNRFEHIADSIAAYLMCLKLYG